MEALLNAIDANDSQTGAHVRRVAAYALVLADARSSMSTKPRLSSASPSFTTSARSTKRSSISSMSTPHLTPDERRAISTHPQRGADVLAPLGPFYPDLCEGVIAHHERWDGTGYPKGLRGNQIPLSARIVTLADTFDAVTHNRRYRDGRAAASAAEIIAGGRGTQFDPELVDLMLLPPVFDQIIDQQRAFSRAPRARGHDRRRGERETAPDVTFRWRSELPAQTAQDLASQESP